MSESATHYDIAVVGGGAAGIMAAMAARASGASVVLLEKAERLGKKILISGGGKCNLTNMEVDLANFHGSHPRFVSDVLRSFSNYDLIDWINGLGVPTRVDEKNGKVWPERMLSKVVVKALWDNLDVVGVDTRVRCGLKSAKREDNGIFTLNTTSGPTLRVRALILASGGLAAPQLGADGSGLSIAESFGHSLVGEFPALVGLEAKELWMPELQGLTCEDVNIRLTADNREMLAVRGSLLFTHYGVNSPAIFRISREVDAIIKEGKEAKLLINFNPTDAPDWESACRLIDETLGGHTKKRCGTVAGYAFGARRLGDAMIREIGIDPERRVRELQKKHYDGLKELVFRAPVKLIGTQGFKRAEIMRGGVDVRKIDPRTMASKIVEGLYICGEMLDVDADVGGYNFQFAFGSGKAAGEAAAASLA